MAARISALDGEGSVEAYRVVCVLLDMVEAGIYFKGISLSDNLPIVPEMVGQEAGQPLRDRKNKQRIQKLYRNSDQEINLHCMYNI